MTQVSRDKCRDEINVNTNKTERINDIELAKTNSNIVVVDLPFGDILEQKRRFALKI